MIIVVLVFHERRPPGSLSVAAHSVVSREVNTARQMKTLLNVFSHRTISLTPSSCAYMYTTIFRSFDLKIPLMSAVQTQACTYAALMLSDAGVPASAENIEAAVKAAGIEVRATVPILFARYLEKKSIEELIAAAASVQAVAPAAAAGGAPAAGGAAAAAGGKKDEPAEEDDDEMGFGLFD